MYPEQTVSEHVFITPHRQRYQPASVTVCAPLDKTERTGVFWLDEDKKKNKYSSKVAADADSVAFCRRRGSEVGWFASAAAGSECVHARL